MFTSILATNWGCDADEVHPRILVGDQAAAKNIKFLKRKFSKKLILRNFYSIDMPFFSQTYKIKPSDQF